MRNRLRCFVCFVNRANTAIVNSTNWTQGMFPQLMPRTSSAVLPVTGFIKSTKMLQQCKHFGVAYYDGREENLTDIEEWLSSFKGGKVTLCKDENSGIAKITLDHQNKRNAMSGLMMVQLGEIVRTLESWTEGKGVLLRGEGSIFCSGGDLDFARASAGAEGGFKMACYMHDVLSRLKALPMLSAALVHGQGALGGGAEIATACDWRLMTKDCSGIGMVHTRMGIVPAWGASSRLAAIVGPRVALELISSGRVVPPQESLQIGLVDHIVDPGSEDSGTSDAMQWLQNHTRADAQVIRAAKATMVSYNQHIGSTKALEDERRLFAPLWGGPANEKALNSRIKHLK